MRIGKRLGLAAALGILAAGAFGQTPPLTSVGDTYHAPRMDDGHPDMQGLWAMGALTPLERPDGVKTTVVRPDEARKLIDALYSDLPPIIDPVAYLSRAFPLTKVRGELRSSLIVAPPDGHLPLTDAGKALVARDQAMRDHAFDDPEQRGTSERCISGVGQAPILSAPGFVPSEIVETRDAILIMTDETESPRIIHMTGTPPPDVMRSFDGYSSGKWEGDTLVVVTTHLRPDDPYREQFMGVVPVSADSRITERFTRVSNTELVEQFTVEDPKLYTGPWLGEFTMTRTDKPILEYACHENNAIDMAGLLIGGRAAAGRAAKRMKTP